MDVEPERLGPKSPGPRMLTGNAILIARVLSGFYRVIFPVVVNFIPGG